MTQRLHIIYMEELPASGYTRAVAAGWYGGSHSVNAPVYNRVTSRAAAGKFSAAAAVRLITEFRSKGYGCSAEPPIVVTY